MRYGSYWHKADNRCAASFWSLTEQSGHWKATVRLALYKYGYGPTRSSLQEFACVHWLDAPGLRNFAAQFPRIGLGSLRSFHARAQIMLICGSVQNYG